MGEFSGSVTTFSKRVSNHCHLRPNRLSIGFTHRSTHCVWPQEYSRCVFPPGNYAVLSYPSRPSALALISLLLRVLSAFAFRNLGALLPLFHLPINTREIRDRCATSRPSHMIEGPTRPTKIYHDVARIFIFFVGLHDKVN